MAYTTPNIGLIRPWQSKGRRRYGIYSASMLVGGSDDAGGTFATTTANKTIKVPPGRIVGVQYGKRTAAETYAAATSGALTTKAESTAGVQIFTDAALTSVQDGFAPVGTTAVDEGRAATAATDGFSGGFPIRGGIFSSIASGTDGERIVVDYLVRHTTYAKVFLRAVGSAGSATASYVLDLGGPGVLAAVAVDFGSALPAATTDLTITADDATTGTALFTSTNSVTDLAPSLIGRPGLDEAVNVTAATDGTEACNGFKKLLIVKIDQTDAYAGATTDTLVELWIDD